MLDLVAQHLTEAVAIALSPMPLIALIALMIAGSRSAAFAWVLGWFLTVAAGIGIAAATGRATPVGEAADDTGVNYLAFVIAGLFLYLAFRSFQQRPAPGTQATEPSWLAALGEMSTAKVFGLSVLLMTLNAKNLPIYASIGSAIAASELPTGASVGAGVILALVGSLSALVVFGIAVLGGEPARRMLLTWRAWLVQNNATVMGVLFLILGVTQLGNAIGSI